MQNRNENSIKVMAALALRGEQDEAEKLVQYISEDRKEVFLKFIERHINPQRKDSGGRPQRKDSGGKYENRDSVMRSVISQLVAAEKFSSLSEVHPAWILEKLLSESPQVIGIILRYLPSKHVRYILKHMPPMVKAEIPNMVESFAVAAPILEVVRRRFEGHFLPMRISRNIETFEIDNLYYLQGNDLLELIRDLGITELAMALLGLPPGTLYSIFNRLDLKDAKRLQRRILDMTTISAGLRRQARAGVLETKGKHVGSKEFLITIGLIALVNALYDDDEWLVSVIGQKLPPTYGYLLKRFVDERRLRKVPNIIEERRAMVLNTVKLMSREGRIDPVWSGYFGTSDASVADETSISEKITEGFTSTAEVLAS